MDSRQRLLTLPFTPEFHPGMTERPPLERTQLQRPCPLLYPGTTPPRSRALHLGLGSICVCLSQAQAWGHFTHCHPRPNAILFQMPSACSSRAVLPNLCPPVYPSHTHVYELYPLFFKQLFLSAGTLVHCLSSRTIVDMR